MRRILLQSVAWPALPHFSTLSRWRNDFRGGGGGGGVFKKKIVFFFFFVWGVCGGGGGGGGGRGVYKMHTISLPQIWMTDFRSVHTPACLLKVARILRTEQGHVRVTETLWTVWLPGHIPDKVNNCWTVNRRLKTSKPNRLFHQL